MAFVYEKIPEEEKENLKIKLKRAEKWIADIQKKYEKLDPFEWVEYYQIPKDNMWIRDKINDISVVRYGFSDFYYNSDRGYADEYTSLMFLVMQDNIIAFEMNEYSFHTISIHDIYVNETMEETYIIKMIKEALMVYTKKEIIFFEKIIFA